jgi:hypothetical protein
VAVDHLAELAPDRVPDTTAQAATVGAGHLGHGLTALPIDASSSPWCHRPAGSACVSKRHCKQSRTREIGADAAERRGSINGGGWTQAGFPPALRDCHQYQRVCASLDGMRSPRNLLIGAGLLLVVGLALVLFDSQTVNGYSMGPASDDAAYLSEVSFTFDGAWLVTKQSLGTLAE